MPDAAGDLLTGLCHDLGALRAGAGGPSLRVLAAQVGLGKSQLGAILRGQVRAIPDWSVVRGVVAACHRYARESGRVGPLPHGGGLEEYWRPRYAAVEHLLSQPRAPAVPPRADAFAPVVPRQLPPPVRRFVGRRAELAALAGAAGPVVLSGAAGVGKTALAVSWAHRVAARFPDGQLYVNLRGFDPAGAALTAAEAVRGFLDAFAVPPHRVPAGRDAQVGLYRSLLADRRVLVVLDNARDAEQVRPLLPGSPGCLAVVTSRGRLAGLVATEGAEPLWLDLLSPAEATELLASRVGADRLAAERAAATRLVAACARLPWALCVVAGRAAVQPARALAA
ncbi:MAG TPA: NB-ARC domain-containing protein, partial [Pilimelia sp.]|nr:NB-ARC domain-containing protein [Pilimelia sp.]